MKVISNDRYFSAVDESWPVPIEAEAFPYDNKLQPIFFRKVKTGCIVAKCWHGDALEKFLSELSPTWENTAQIRTLCEEIKRHYPEA
jgi:hypothetical protein